MKRICFVFLMILGLALPGQTQGYDWSLKLGKYSCTASKYVQGAYEFVPRGSFVLSENRRYTYYGFEKPSSGTFTLDSAGNLLFFGGYFDGGKAEKTDRVDRFLLVFPSNPDHRWSCSLSQP